MRSSAWKAHELAHDQHLERCVRPLGYLERDRDTVARQHHRCIVLPAAQPIGELASRLTPIAEPPPRHLGDFTGNELPAPSRAVRPVAGGHERDDHDRQVGVMAEGMGNAAQ
jgi:hypothetical protein